MVTKKVLFEKLSKSHTNGIRAGKSNGARVWLESKGLSIELTGAGFSSGQLHHRREQSWLDELVSIGYLTPSDGPTRTGKTGYTTFGKKAIVFPLKNEDGETVNFYSIQIERKNQPASCLNATGLYPSFPHPLTSRLFITTSIIDAASILEGKLLENRDAVIALSDGELLPQHLKAIGRLNQLKELLVFVDGNLPARVIPTLTASFQHIMVVPVELPIGESLNDMLLNYGVEAIFQLIAESEQEQEQDQQLIDEGQESLLEVVNPSKLVFRTELGTYSVLGELPADLGSLKVSVHFEELTTKRKSRNKADLYDRAQLLNLVKIISEASSLNANDLEADLLKLTALLEAHRDKVMEENNPTKAKRIANVMPPEKEREALAFLSEPNLLKRMDELIAQSGIVGEENNRLTTFVIASTYKMANPLHGMIQATSGSGKSHLINAIADLMPKEDVINMTRITSKSLYHYQKDDLMGKLILIQDIDGLDSEAKFAFRELQSAKLLSSSITLKDSYGNLKSTVKSLKASFASLVATTHSEVYLDNMSRSIILGIDEGQEQTDRIIQYQNGKLAGRVDEGLELKAKVLLQNCIRCLKPYAVVNGYADKIQLPVEAKMRRRLNSHYQEFVSQITILNQYQREKDEQGRLIATIEDLKLASEIVFEALMWKVDELDSSLRQFFERLKAYIGKQLCGKQTKFTQREVRQALNESRSQMARFMSELLKLEYINIVDGAVNRGYKYQIQFWDDIGLVRKRVQDGLARQVEQFG